MQLARKVGCWRIDEDEMLTCLKMSDPVGLTMAGKIDVLLLLGKGEESQFARICTGAYVSATRIEVVNLYCFRKNKQT